MVAELQAYLGFMILVVRVRVRASIVSRLLEA